MPHWSRPAGHSYYVLFPRPNTRPDRLVGGRARATATRSCRRCSSVACPASPTTIEVESVVTPADWQAQGLAAGAPFAAAHTFAQSGPFRFPTLDRRVENLVFCGSNTQPGVGRADGAAVRQAGRRPHHRLSAPDLHSRHPGTSQPAFSLRDQYRVMNTPRVVGGRTASFLRAAAASGLAALSVLLGVSFSDLVAHDRPTQSVSAADSRNGNGPRYARGGA